MTADKDTPAPGSPSDRLPELKNIIIKNTIPNAMLFTGSSDTFLKKCAVTFGKAVNCLDPAREKPFSQIPCNQCRSCRKIMAGMHPDIITLSPDNGSIKIAAIRELYQLIISNPHEARMRSVLVENAEMMNEQAQNAFLKMLEEPPANTFFILITGNTNRLLATIISRCHTIRILRNAASAPEPDFITESREDSDRKGVENLSQRRQWLLKEIICIISDSRDKWFTRLKPLLLAEKLSRETDLLKDSLAIVRDFLRDLAIIRYKSENIINNDYKKDLTGLSGIITPEKSTMFLTELFKTEERNQSNPSSIRLNLESFFLKLSLNKI